MTKKKKVLIISIIVAICAAITILVLWLFVFKSIKGEWYAGDPNDYIGEGSNSTTGWGAGLPEKYLEPCKYVFEDEIWTVYNKYGDTLYKYYYKKDGDKLYFSTDITKLDKEYYIITKLSSSELRFKGTRVSDEEIILKRK